MLAVAGRKTGLIMTNTRKRHTPEQVVRKLGQADRMLADGADVAAVCRELGVSEQTYYRWRNQYGGLKADDAKRLKELEKQNATLKRLLAEAELEKAALKELESCGGTDNGFDLMKRLPDGTLTTEF